ncbi:hypothetical protein B0T20DRAFT_356594, partial [Sordaria brevicollis]
QIRGNATDKSLAKNQKTLDSLLFDWPLSSVTSQTGLFLQRNNWTGNIAGRTRRIDGGSSKKKHAYSMLKNEFDLLRQMRKRGVKVRFGMRRPLMV